MSQLDYKIKCSFDFILSLIGTFVLFPVILIAWLVASIETKSNGFYFQKRVGKDGRTFLLIKIKTMRIIEGFNSNITLLGDKRITRGGALFRKLKVDELPQIWNVLLGQMSFVGPRPDVIGYADKLTGKDKKILSIRPGITGPASIKYKNEGKLLSKCGNPQKYNDEVIWPDKVKINYDYLTNWSLRRDILYIYLTIVDKDE